MSAMSEVLLAPEVRPFAVAAAIMVVLGGIEVLTTLVGLSIGELFGKDIDVDADHHTGLGGLFLWINAGRLPLLILIILALGLFSIIGFLLHGIAHGLGLTMPVWIAVPVAAAGSIPLIRAASRGIARIIPRDESYAVNESDFVGHIGEVAVGPLDQGLPGRVSLKDVFGNWHSVAARASHDSNALPVGTSVLLVDRDAKSFIAISAPVDLIAQRQSSNRT
jgi:hypothetical protein